MARRFFYISLGILCLAIAYNLGARSARADWDPSGMGCIAGVDGTIYWSRSGEAWSLDEYGDWSREANLDLSVSASQVVFTGKAYGPTNSIVTSTDDVWFVSISNGSWVEADPFPGCGGTPVEKDSWSGVKQRFRD